jgi:hypothetical protein
MMMSDTRHQQQLDQQQQSTSAASTNRRSNNNNNNITPNKKIIRSLCGPYVLETMTTGSFIINDDATEIFQMRYTLLPIRGAVSPLQRGTLKTNHSNGTTNIDSSVLAWTILQPQNQQEQQNDDGNDDNNFVPTHVINAKCTPSINRLQIQYLDDKNHPLQYRPADSDSEFLAVLSRIIAQQTLSSFHSCTTRQKQPNQSKSTTVITMELLNDETITCTVPTTLFLGGDSRSNRTPNNDVYTSFIRSFFHQPLLLADTTLSELVEMVYVVDPSGAMGDGHHHNVLGVVPRHYIHQYNLLHRGVGILVTKDKPIQMQDGRTNRRQQEQQPDIYCHQRTATNHYMICLLAVYQT